MITQIITCNGCGQKGESKDFMTARLILYDGAGFYIDHSSAVQHNTGDAHFCREKCVPRLHLDTSWSPSRKEEPPIVLEDIIKDLVREVIQQERRE
jgi:hypothetical protein